jgi:outer membrane protein assembly factor BamA
MVKSPGRPARWTATAAAVVSLILLTTAAAPGQVEVQAGRDSVQVGKLSLTGYPYIFYTPEIEFAIGGALILSMPLSADTNVKASNAMISGYYSQKSSYDLFLNPEFFLGDDKYYIGLSIDFFRYVDKYWGIGNNTPDIDSADYVRKIFWTNLEVDVRTWGPLKIGFNYDLNYTEIVDKGANELLLSGETPGSDGGLTSGIGLVLFADTRNSPFYSSRGGYYKLSFLNAAPWLGSDYSFSRWILDLRQYIQLSNPLILAVQGYGSLVSGDTPFYLYPALGGDNVMRGYYEGRYRDKFYAAVQGELRARLTNRWGVVGWVGLGDVAAGWDEFKMTQAKPSFGFGLRFALDPEQVLNVRADFAYGKDTKGIYFNAKEAF